MLYFKFVIFLICYISLICYITSLLQESDGNNHNSFRPNLCGTALPRGEGPDEAGNAGGRAGKGVGGILPMY